MPQESETTVNAEARGPAIHDLVIRRTHVFDGHQALAGLYDVAVDGQEIASVSAGPLRGRREVDAAEGWVMPGLIDTHIHLYDVHAVSGPDSLRAFEEHGLLGSRGCSSTTGSPPSSRWAIRRTASWTRGPESPRAR
ncbi:MULTISPECIES: hypothetical protein [Streptomyces]|uniref:Uncharacterized protein n=1 Tax=Streptomyces eurythermus TaxID=42237 RepID=A0ABW6YSH5_9ACTN|nr:MULTISPECIES: hypothetical protein [Streptomyces]